MKIKNLGLDSTIPYKLSNIVYHFEKFLNSYWSGETLKEYKSYLKENDLESLILTKTPSVLIDSVIERIMVGDWEEISYNMDYSTTDKLILKNFFQSIYNDYVNKTPDWEEFYNQLLQDNLDDLVIEEENDFVANAYYTISNGISLEIEIADGGDALRIKYNNDISDWLPIEYKIDEYSDNEEDTIPYVMYGEMEIDLNNVMRIDNNYFENENNLINNDDLDYDNYEIEINTLDILNNYQEEKSLKGNVEFTLESDDNTYQVEFEYLNNTNQVNLFDIETLDGIVVEFDNNNLEIIKNEIINQLKINDELNIKDNVKIIEDIINDNSFPNKQFNIYYPFLNIESSLILSDSKLIKLLNEIINNEEFTDSIKIINDYAISLTPEYKDFKTLWELLLDTIPGSNLENNEEIIYFSLPNNELNLKIYISAEIWNYIDELIK